MAAARAIDVQEFIDAHPLSNAQRLLILLCFLVVAIDGFDTDIVGFIAPAIRTEWRLDVTSLGPLFAAGLFGLMLGSFAVGPAADRYGRKTMLIVSVLCFSGGSFASAFSPGISTLIWLRFLTGLGLGGAMPTAITLTSMPERSALFARHLDVLRVHDRFRNRRYRRGERNRRLRLAAASDRGGIMPVFWPQCLRGAARVGSLSRVQRRRRAAGSRGAGGVARGRLRGRDVCRQPRAAIVTGAAAVRRRPAQGTLLLWLAFFMTLLVVYLLQNWMPTLIQRSGISLSRASLITAALQVGGTVGAVVIGRLMDRANPHVVLGVAYIAAGGFVSLIGMAAAAPWLMALAVFGAGFCVSGGQVGANALAAAFYPTAYRTTGVSWAIGVGRSGSILGSFLGGAMLAQDWGLTVRPGRHPAAISGVAMLTLGAVRRRT